MGLPPLAINLSCPDLNVMEVYLSFAAALGIRRMSIDNMTLMKAAEDKEFGPALAQMAYKYHITFFDAHAPYGVADSLGNPIPGALERSTQTMLAALRGAAALGVRIVTMHAARTRLVGEFAPPSGAIEDVDLDGAVDRVMSQLDILLPEAEKLGIIIALENLFLPSSLPGQLLRILDKARHAHLGLCYDTGHALIVEKQPGKTPDMITKWITVGWANSIMTLQDDQLDLMLNEVVTTHLHDNDGFEDLHQMPGSGIADWQSIVSRLRKAPRLLSIQSEVLKPCLIADWRQSLQQFAALGIPVS